MNKHAALSHADLNALLLKAIKDGASFQEIYRIKGQLLHAKSTPKCCFLCDKELSKFPGLKIADSHVVPNNLLKAACETFSVGGQSVSRHKITWRLFCEAGSGKTTEKACESLLSEQGETPFAELFFGTQHNTGLLSQLKMALETKSPFSLTKDYGPGLLHCVSSLCYRHLLIDLNNPESWDGSPRLAPEAKASAWLLFEQLRDYVVGMSKPAPHVAMFLDEDLVVAEPGTRMDDIVHKLMWSTHGEASILFGIRGAYFMVSQTGDALRTMDASAVWRQDLGPSGQLQISDACLLALPDALEYAVAMVCAEAYENDVLPYHRGEAESAGMVSRRQLEIQGDDEASHVPIGYMLPLPECTLLLPVIAITDESTTQVFWPPDVNLDTGGQINLPGFNPHAFVVKRLVLLPIKTLAYTEQGLQLKDRSFSKDKEIQLMPGVTAILLTYSFGDKKGQKAVVFALVEGLKCVVFGYDLDTKNPQKMQPMAGTSHAHVVFESKDSEAMLGRLLQ